MMHADRMSSPGQLKGLEVAAYSRRAENTRQLHSITSAAASFFLAASAAKASGSNSSSSSDDDSDGVGGGVYSLRLMTMFRICQRSTACA